MSLKVTIPSRVKKGPSQMAPNQHYAVSVYDPSDQGDTLVFTFVPNGSSREQGANRRQKPPEFIVRARQEPARPVLEWAETSDDPGPAKEEIEAEVRARLNDKSIWIDRITALVGQIEKWAQN